MGENSKPKGFVDFGETFRFRYNNRYSENTLDRIDDFIDHVEENGLHGWVGKVGNSRNVPENYDDREAIIEKAEKHSLWHAHLGDPEFKDSRYGNYKVSDWVIHFQKFSNYHIKLLDLGYHNPMELPDENLINE